MWLDLRSGLFGFGYIVTTIIPVAAMRTAPGAPLGPEPKQSLQSSGVRGVKV
jgi:hypothetical protein